MRFQSAVVVVCLCGASLVDAQTRTSSSGPDDNEGTFVRRISAGATLSVLGLSLLKGGSTSVTNSTIETTSYSSTAASQRIGYGGTAQLAISKHMAVSVSALLRRIGYTSDTTDTITNGTLSSQTSTHEDTRARLIDIPFLLRYYNRGRHTAGPRWFVEGGGALRKISGIRTSISSTDASGTLSCCTSTPAVPANRNPMGVVAGLGMQLIDDVGIHVVPEVRYTRWFNPTFDTLTAHSQRNQVEVGLTLSF
ncbi:MAG: outer membrane beta-barrel protein [Bryobacteraceae bacterium]